MFLISTFITTSSSSAHTSQPNFISNRNNLVQDEHIILVRNLRDTELSRADTVLNLAKKTIIKCRDYSRFSSDNYADIFGYFHAIYPEQLDMATQIVPGE